MNSDKLKLVVCPTCKEKTPYSTENAFRPFCSDRCKLIDLGAWASEEFRIPLKASNEADFSRNQLLQANEDDEN